MDDAEEMDVDIKTTVLTNIPIVTEEVYTEHILSDDLTVLSNSDGNLTINTVEQVVEVTEPTESSAVEPCENEEEEETETKATVYITHVGQPADDTVEGEFEEYELYEAEEDEEPNDEEEEDSSLVDDPNYEVEEEKYQDEEEEKRYECERCKRSFKTPAVSYKIIIIVVVVVGRLGRVACFTGQGNEYTIFFLSFQSLKRHVTVTHTVEEQQDDPLNFKLCLCCDEPLDSAHTVFFFLFQISLLILSLFLFFFVLDGRFKVWSVR